MVNECLEWINFAENDILTAETMSKLTDIVHTFEIHYF